jgi:hypothetical protein
LMCFVFRPDTGLRRASTKHGRTAAATPRPPLLHVRSPRRAGVRSTRLRGLHTRTRSYFRLCLPRRATRASLAEDPARVARGQEARGRAAPSAQPT